MLITSIQRCTVAEEVIHLHTLATFHILHVSYSYAFYGTLWILLYASVKGCHFMCFIGHILPD